MFLARLAIVLFLIGLVIAVLWLDRDGLRDHSDGDLSFSDVVYFAMIPDSAVE